VGCNYENLAEHVKLGSIVYLNKGTIMGEIIDIKKVSFDI
jgi:hypothetical protein